MKKTILCLCLALFIGAGLLGSPAPATEIDLFEMAFNINGTRYDNLESTGTIPFPVPGLNTASFNETTGLGTLTWTTSTPGSYSFFSFFDHEIDEFINGFANETAFARGDPPVYNAAGPWFWQAEEPGWVWGDLWMEFYNSNYENKIGYGGTHPEFDDVAMGIGTKFNLADGYQAIVTLTLDTNAPTGALWYLEQFDPDSQASIYFWADFETRSTGVVPLPGTLLLLGSGLAAMAGLRLKLRK